MRSPSFVAHTHVLIDHGSSLGCTGQESSMHLLPCQPAGMGSQEWKWRDSWQHATAERLSGQGPF